MAVNFSNYYNKISNSGHDERGQYTNGAAGDQGGEWTICNWYQYPWDGGWRCVLRYPDREVRELIAEIAIEAANNDKIGYDQNQRYTYWNQLQSVGYRPSKITVACEADCSAGVIANVRAAGYLLNIPALKNIGASYTGNMRSGFSAAGFQVLTDSKYLTSSAYLVPGDILLNDYDHTATNLGIGSSSGYVVDYSSYNQSSLTAKQIKTRLKAVGWTSLKVDDKYDSAMVKAVKEFQELYELQVDGKVGPKTEKVLKAVYKIVKTDGFDYKYYSNKYSDLKKAYGTNLKLLLHHYYKYGKNEGRKIKDTSSSTTSASTATSASTKASTSNELTFNTTGNYSKTPKKYGVVNANLLNVRTGPSTSYSNLREYPTLSKGNEVDVCDKTKDSDGNTWYYIRIAGKIFGFVSGKWLTVSNYK